MVQGQRCETEIVQQWTQIMPSLLQYSMIQVIFMMKLNNPSLTHGKDIFYPMVALYCVIHCQIFYDILHEQ
jgi:hypothetical protein